MLFSNKNDFVTNNSKKITSMYTLLYLNKFISNPRKTYEFSWVIESQMLMLPWMTSKDSTLWISNKENEANPTMPKLQHHTITQILLILFKYIDTINLGINNIKINFNSTSISSKNINLTFVCCIFLKGKDFFW